MKIVFDGYALRFPRTGIVNYGYAVARGYRERLRPQEFRILIGDRNVTDHEIAAFLQHGDVAAILEGHRESFIEKIERKLTGNVFRNYMPGLGSAVSKATRGFDIYHCIDWFFEPPRSTKLNVITWFDLTTTLFPQFHEELNITKERMKMKRLANFDHVFCISAATRNDLLKHADIDPDKVTVNYIDTDPIFDRYVFFERQALLAKYGIPKDHRYLLSVSTIEPRKNFRQVLDAFGAFVRANPKEPYVLVCTGMWGWKNDDLKNYLAECGFADRVIFTGFADLTDLPSLYHHADCFLYLSLYEGFGLPILEAMKSGCPVICSDTSSMPEVIGDAGILVSPSDVDGTGKAIDTVVHDAARAEQMRAAGFARSRMFSWSQHVDRLMQVYEKAR
ncbi:glycosyltransferase family 1 protein [Rhizobium sp. NXC24]|uniref:glycosyltransferase family 4 protein n=1 Tax=Rhizobium sp. NXC24 TaxID=2048897 RepID=UPI000CDF5002|nr:glycosyltransferase family 1 protein [Rhizobium sp. NXC24]AVA25734.1 glycosyltransferase family 1 protein [Rhizobium sp. NXC24]